ncbi:hypothetical protein MRX96_044335 [Rhipicephalus microplus]
MRRIATTKTTGAERETLMTSHPDQERQSRAGAKLSQMLTEVVRGVLVERRGVQGTIGCEMVVVGTSGSSIVHHHLKISKERIVVVLHGISTEKIVAARSLVGTLGMTAVVGTLDELESLEMIALPGLGKVRTGVLGSRNPEVVGLAGSQMINVHHHEKVRQHNALQGTLSTKSALLPQAFISSSSELLEVRRAVTSFFTISVFLKW